MELKSLSQLGRVEKEFVILPEFKVKLHTLSVMEQQKALLNLPTSVTDEGARFLATQQGILVYAIDAINDKKVVVEELQAFLPELQVPLITELFTRYLELVGEQSQILEAIKKK